ncbi:uncharacterized protein LOC129566931 [Sitodiplosis mosellana]|uniref:uncharacterized protein LOC129566931 n=1 Tax=Sitodiplosis mosellana TaxID=263140 RepID=UPI002443DBF3|nr:uncharacterized protein LOC129566931 [Sitodiplosis mosellana]
MPTDEQQLSSSTNSLKRKRESHKKSTDSAEASTKRANYYLRTRRKKLRSLVSIESSPSKKSNKYLVLSGIILIGFIVFVWKNEQFRDELKHVAMNQFQMYLHGRENYCDEPFEHWHIANVLQHRIIGQETVLESIDQALEQHESITALAFIGTQGVGKTLTLNLIQEHFQWHLNIQQYIWSLIQSPEKQLDYLLRIINGLTTCGQNGIFIDSIPIKHVETIAAFNAKLFAHAKENNIKLVVIYAFQTNNPIIASQPVPIDGVKSIIFRQFDSNDIHNCITMESERLKITLPPAQLNDLLEDIDAKRHGCKHVASRIARQDIQDF